MNAVLLFLVAAALVGANLLCGGFRVGYAIPAYILLALAAGLSVFRLRSTPLDSRSRLCLVLTTLCFGYLLGRAFLSPYPDLARSHLFLIVGALIAYFLSALYLTDGRLRAMLVGVLLFIGVANAGVSAIQFFKAHDFMLLPLMPRAESYGARASGFFLSPNSLAGYLEICLLMGLSMVWWGRWSIYGKILAGYACAVCLGGIVMTGSRGGYLSVGFGLLILVSISVYASVRRLRDRGWLVLFGVLGVLLVAGWGVKKSMEESYLLKVRASQMLNEKDVRVGMWQAAMKQFALSPVTGTGSGTYLYYGRQYRPINVQTDPRLVHNDYLQMLAEYGTIGLIAIALVIFEHLRHGLGWLRRSIAGDSRTSDTQSNSLALTIGAVSCIGTYAVHSVVDFNLQIPANALVMACLFGFLAVPMRAPRDTAKSGGAWFEKAWGVVVLGLGVALAFLTIPRIPTELAREKAKILDARWVAPETDVEVEKIVRKGLQSAPADADLQAQLGKALFAQGRDAVEPAPRAKLLDEAIQAYQRASELAANDVTYVVEWAQALDTAGRFAEAEPLHARAVELDPNSGWVHWAWGVHYHLQGDLGRAEAEFQKSTERYYFPGVAGLQRVQQERARVQQEQQRSAAPKQE